MITSTFPTDIVQIKNRISSIDTVAYGKTRNFINGAVTKLSPYLSRGVITLSMVRDQVLKNYSVYQAEKLMQELAWREYYQRVWQAKGNAIFSDLKQDQPKVDHHELPTAIEHAKTGIDAIDNGIKELYHTGYMHNHLRMYTAMLACNVARSHWLMPSSWMYYHLLDGDLASNALSWQWVAGSFSSKKYVANQENINKYTSETQNNSYLSVSYDAFTDMQIPDELRAHHSIKLKTTLPESDQSTIIENAPLFIYTSYQLDPEWHKDEIGNRVLLLEPSHFNQYPVSDLVLQFIIQLAKENIPNINIYCGSFDELVSVYNPKIVYYKEHPLTLHFRGIQEQRNWMFPEISGYYSSFFSYWKKCERYLR